MSLRVLLGAGLVLLLMVPAPGAAALGVDLQLDLRLIKRDVAQLVHDVAAPITAPPPAAAPAPQAPVAAPDPRPAAGENPSDTPADLEPAGQTPVSSGLAFNPVLPWLVTLAAAISGVIIAGQRGSLARLRGGLSSAIRVVLSLEVVATAGVLAWYDWCAGVPSILADVAFLALTLLAWISLLLAWDAARGTGRASVVDATTTTTVQPTRAVPVDSS